MSDNENIEDLEYVDNKLKDLQREYPELYQEFVKLFKNDRDLGYEVICQLITGATTLDKLI